MPIVGEDIGYILNMMSVLSSSIYPVALSLLLPVFMYLIVLEKEEKLLQMMKMNGMKIQYYWMTIYLFYLIITAITFCLFVWAGTYFLELDFFINTAPSLIVSKESSSPPSSVLAGADHHMLRFLREALHDVQLLAHFLFNTFIDPQQCIVFIGWGLAQISISIFFQVFISKAQSATILGYLLSVF